MNTLKQNSKDGNVLTSREFTQKMN